MPAYSTLLPRDQEPIMQTPDIRIALSHFLRQIEAAHVRTTTGNPKPLQFNSLTGELSEFFWPCEPNPSGSPYDEVRRVAPSDLESHRRTHRFKGPSCLCAFLDGKEYTEAQIAVVEVLSKDEERNRCVLNGEYVAQCARQRCGYLLCLERFFALNDLRLLQYPPRVHPLPVQSLVHIPDIEKSFRRGDGLFQVMPDIVLRGNRRNIERVNPNEAKIVNIPLMKRLMAGVWEDEFWAIFVQCLQCGKVAVRQHYGVNHQCSPNLKLSSTGTSLDNHARSNKRHHPYRRIEAEDRVTVRPRPLVRMDTILIGDEPEARPFPALTGQHRASSPDSSYNYDPEEVTIQDNESTDWGSIHGSDFEPAQEDESGALEENPVSEDLPTEPWWIHDAPELPSDDSLPDIMSLFAETRPLQAESNVRTDAGSSGEIGDVVRLESSE